MIVNTHRLRMMMVVLALAAAVTPAPLHAQRIERRVGPGVTHISEFISTGPLNFNVLRIDLGNPGICIESGQGQDRSFAGEKVADMARRKTYPGHAVVGAVNADFWSMVPKSYMPVGLSVSDGMIYNTPGARSVMAVMKDGRVHMGPATMKTALTAGGQTFNITRINDPVASGGLVLFTPPFSPAASRAAMTYVALKYTGRDFLPNQPLDAEVIDIAQSFQGPVGAGKLALGIGADSKPALVVLKKGAKVRILASVPEAPGVIVSCVGGGPRLARAGKVSVEWEQEKVGKNFTTDRHPRTAAGITADGKTLYLVTVDGRQPVVSIGQSLLDLAEYMVSLGCSDAINLDGGGSTTMVVRGGVVNKPSDLNGPRTVTNALLAVSIMPAGPLAQLEIEPAGVMGKRISPYVPQPFYVPAGVEFRMQARGYDEAFNPLGVARLGLTWTADAALGSVLGNSEKCRLQTSGNAAQGAVKVKSASDTTGSANIGVAVIDKITIDPDVLVLGKGERIVLDIRATAGGRELLMQEQMITISASEGSVGITTSVVSALREGQGKLVVRVGSVSRDAHYYVDRFRAVELASFDDAAMTAPTGTNFEPAKTGVTIERENKKQGAGCAAVTYIMKTGGTTRINLPVNARIETAPAKIGLWIYGDGKQARVCGEVVDAAKHRFMADFTEGSKGVYWKNEWRQVLVPVRSFTARPANPGAVIQFPAVMKDIYIAQDQESLKTSGTLLLDGLEAIYPPNP
ncbi:MAG: phosphodiester glycosidase family protein [bacterium]